MTISSIRVRALVAGVVGVSLAAILFGSSLAAGGTGGEVEAARAFFVGGSTPIK